MDKQTVYWLKGLPASGKSTYARELVFRSNGGVKRVNKDDIRAMVDCGRWSKERERMIDDIQFDMIKRFLIEGYSVVCDNTNFATKHFDRLKKIISDEGLDKRVEIVEKFFDVPLMECIDRDAKRGDKSVGREVIYRMWNAHIRPKNPSNPKGKPAYIMDIDGTLALMNGRGPYDLTKVKTDLVNPPVFAVYQALKACGANIIIFSGREAICEKDTKEWLADNGITYEHFDMRRVGDNRSDVIVKRELFDKIKDEYNIIGVFDDRESVCGGWREMGLTVFQVDYGMF